MTNPFVLSICIRSNIAVVSFLLNDCALIFRLYIVMCFFFSVRVVFVTSEHQISFTVTENCPRHYVVGDMSVYMTPSNSSISPNIYSMESIENEHPKDLFLINSQTGLIRINRVIDRELICPNLSATTGTCALAFFVTILNEILNIVIIIVDENDNPPLFLQRNVTISIKESSPTGTKMYLTPAKDLDSVYNGIGNYSLTSGKGVEMFLLHYNSSVIYLESSQGLDYEVCTLYSLILSVCDKGTPRLCDSQGIFVTIIDINDNYPVFSQAKYLAIIKEDQPLGKEVLSVHATDQDSRQYGVVSYRFSSINNEALAWFNIDYTTGSISLIQPLNLRIRNFKFVVEALDNGPVPNVNRTLVSVHVKEVNNRAPEIRIRKSTFPTAIVQKGDHKTEVAFFENNPKNTDVIFVVVTYGDSYDNDLLSCSIERKESQNFKLEKFNRNRNKVIYRLVALESTNCELAQRYVIIVNCSDSGDRAGITLKTIEIVVLDINEFPARFNQSVYAASIKENTASFVMSMPIIDEDCHFDVSIEISDKYAREHFKYSLSSQELVLSAPLDHEETQSLRFVVKIIDNGRDNRVLFSTAVIDIAVIDINDNVPALVDPRIFYVEENSRIGLTIGKLKATDLDTNLNAKTQFQKVKSLAMDENVSEYNSFFITSDGTIRLAKKLDREQQELYLLTVEVTDMGLSPLSSTATITIFVTDLNDNSPQWVFPNKNDNKINESLFITEGAVLTRVHAVDIDGLGNNNITYHLLGDNSKHFFLHPATGELRFASQPRLGAFTLDLVALDNGRPVRSNQTKLIIYISENDVISSVGDMLASRSYFTIVAVVPVMILICVLVLILCLLLVVRRRNAKKRIRRSQQKTDKSTEDLFMKTNNHSNTNEKLLKVNMKELHSPEILAKSRPFQTLDLTKVTPLPTVSYQCLVGHDLDVCSADSGQGASEEEFSNYLVLKCNDEYQERHSIQHCCSPLPENSIAHFICSKINYPIIASQNFRDSSSLFLNKDPRSFQSI